MEGGARRTKGAGRASLSHLSHDVLGLLQFETVSWRCVLIFRSPLSFALSSPVPLADGPEGTFGMAEEAPRPPLPPFTLEEAIAKVRAAEDAWNTREPAKIALAYTADTRWRNRAEFLHGREQVQAFLSRKWERELDYRLIKEIWAHAANRIAVRFVYEYRDDSNNWCVAVRRLKGVP